MGVYADSFSSFSFSFFDDSFDTLHKSAKTPACKPTNSNLGFSVVVVVMMVRVYSASIMERTIGTNILGFVTTEEDVAFMGVSATADAAVEDVVEACDCARVAVLDVIWSGTVDICFVVGFSVVAVVVAVGSMDCAGGSAA